MIGGADVISGVCETGSELGQSLMEGFLEEPTPPELGLEGCTGRGVKEHMVGGRHSQQEETMG